MESGKQGDNSAAKPIEELLLPSISRRAFFQLWTLWKVNSVSRRVLASLDEGNEGSGAPGAFRYCWTILLCGQRKAVRIKDCILSPRLWAEDSPVLSPQDLMSTDEDDATCFIREDIQQAAQKFRQLRSKTRKATPAVRTASINGG